MQGLGFVSLVSDVYFHRIDGELSFFFREKDIDETFTVAGSSVNPLELCTDAGALDYLESLQIRDSGFFGISAVLSGYSDSELKLILDSDRVAADGRSDLCFLAAKAGSRQE